MAHGKDLPSTLNILVDGADPVATSIFASLVAGANISITTTVVSGDTKILIAGTGMVGGSGTAGTIPKWATSSTLDDSIIREESGKIGIAASAFTPVAGLHVRHVDGLAATKPTAQTNAARTPFSVVHESSLNITDGFAVSIQFFLEDDTSGLKTAGTITATRAGGDDTTTLSLSASNAGVQALGIKIFPDSSVELTNVANLFKVDATASEIQVGGVNGIDYNPGSDIDTDLMTVVVTGDPRQYWFESQNMFMYTFTGNSRIGLQATTGNDSILSFFEAATEKARVHYDGGTEFLKLIVGSSGLSSTVMDLVTDGEIKIHNQGETNPTVTSDTFSHWAADASGAGTCSPFWETEDGTTITLAAISLMTDLNLSGLTASQIVETDAGKQLVSVAKGTAYNKAFGTSAGTVMEGNQAVGGNQLAAFDPNQATFPATAPAAAASRNEHPLIAFDDSTDENIIFHSVISADYSAGSLTVDLHWVAATATTGDVKWDVAFERIADAGQDIDSDGFAAIQTVTETTDGTSGVVTKTSITFTQAQADAIAASDAFRLKVTRDADAGGDTLVGDAQLLRVSIRQ